MNVGIDARALLSERTGIGVYTDHIARGLAATPGIDVTIFTPRKIRPALLPKDVRSRAGCHPFGTVWLQTHLGRELVRARCDVLLSAVTIAPVRLPIPFVPVVHDLTPLTHPEWHRRKTVVAFLPWIERTLERAARIIAVSHATAAEVRGRFPEVGEKIVVVEHGVDPRFSPASDPAERDFVRHALTRGNPFILSFGTLEPRKNLGTLVAACERLWQEGRSGPDLLLAGGAGWKSETLISRIDRSPFRDKIHRAGYIPAEHAPAVFRAAEAFCYPSYAEGFGLPVLEAMASGTPAVISTAPALLETAGGAALAAPANDPAAFARALITLLEDDVARRACIARGLKRASGFRWSTTVEKTAAVLRAACAAACAA